MKEATRLTAEQKEEFAKLKKEMTEKAELEEALIQLISEAGTNESKKGRAGRWAR